MDANTARYLTDKFLNQPFEIPDEVFDGIKEKAVNGETSYITYVIPNQASLYIKRLEKMGYNLTVNPLSDTRTQIKINW